MQSGTSIEVDYKLLVPGGKSNARTAGADQQLGELVASIEHHGLLAPLIVRKAYTRADGYLIVAGNRRHAAIGALIEQGKWTGRVPAILRDEDDAEALDLSLAENVVRLPMHPVDQFEAFARLEGEPADIAARYGIEEKVVRQRLALGGLAPEIRKAWRAGELSAKSAQMFARVDKKTQAKTLKALTAGGGGAIDWRVEQALATDQPKLNDPRMRFVGLAAYRAAGGEVVEDLFGDDGHICDPKLLDELVDAAVSVKINFLKIEQGWSWAERLPAGKQAWQLTKSAPGKITYTPAEQKRLDQLQRAGKALMLQQDNLQDSDATGGGYAEKLEAIEAAVEANRDEIDGIKETALARSYSAKQKAKLGCYIEVGDGVARVHYGVDLAKNKGAGKPAAAKLGLEGKAAESADMSQALLQDLTTRQTKAAAAVLSHTPLAALLTLIATLARSTGSPAKISANGYHEVRDGTVGKYATFEAVLKSIDGLDLEELLDKLATLVASSLDLRCFSGSSMSTPAALPSTAAMVSLLHPDQYREAMLREFDHTDYFKRSPAAVAVAAIKEITGGKLNPHESIGKKALASSAAERAKSAGWLPPLLRHPGEARAGTRKAPGKKRARK